MMNIPPSEAKQLTLGEYQGLMHHWNEAHSSEEAELEAPDIETLEARRSRLEAKGVKVLH